MNITREDAVKLPNKDISIIAKIYYRLHEIDLKTGEVKYDHEAVHLAQGHMCSDDHEKFVFHYYEPDDMGGLFEENIGLNGYSEDVRNDSDVYEMNDHTLVYRLLVVTNYIMLDSIKFYETIPGEEKSTKIEERYRTESGNILRGFADEYETDEEKMER